jgi:hypothetical protein
MFLRYFVSGIGGLFMTNYIHSKDAAVFRRQQSFDVLFGALVHASGRAKLDGITRAGLTFLKRPPPIY